jgi:hypothetical protein
MSGGELIPLEEGWSLWRRFVVRGAGFPAQGALGLGYGAAARAIDELIDVASRIEEARLELEQMIGREGRAGDKELWWRARKTVHRVVAGAAVPADLPAAIAPTMASLAELVARAAALRGEAQRAFAEDQRKAAAAVRALASEPRLREAVTWQNRAVLATAFASLLRRGEGEENTEVRKFQRLIAIYLQRYCTKADTIGFFGPVGWGRFAAEGPAVSLRCGPSLLARRQVYFEYWAIDALAQSFAARPGMRPWLAPRRVPVARSEEPAALRMLADCDGEHSARDLAARWITDATLGLAGEEAVYGRLAALVEQGFVYWTLEVPIGDQYPERGLRRMLERVGDVALRKAALDDLDDLERAREAVRAAAGDHEALALALDHANEVFTRLSGVASARNGGRTYAARTILYEDCMRDIDFAIADEPLRGLRGPLALVLEAGRWFTHRVVSGFEEVFETVYGALRGELGRDEVDYLRFWERMAPYMAGGSAVLTGKRSSVGNEAEAELQGRWAKLLELSGEKKRQDFASDRLRPLVRDAFAAPHSGAALMREHSPDVSIAATSTEAIARGEYYFVLSELHTGANTFTKQPLLEQCPFPDELVAQMGRDIPEPELYPVPPKEMNLRISPATYKANDVHFETGSARSWLPRERVLAVADLFVKRAGGRLVVGNRHDARTFAMVDFLQSYIIRSTIQSFSVTPPWPHTPRVTIDRLVIARESWRMAPAEIPFLEVADPFERFVAVRRWARQLGLPRCVFLKTPEERKPTWIDLESLIYVDIFCRAVRKAARVTLTEMLPSIEESWLTDAAGNRYVSELRFVAVDPKVAPP